MVDFFKYCPMCSAEMIFRSEGEIKRRVCPDCGFVQYRNPAPAVGILVLDGNEVLLVKRKFEPFEGLWVIPSGFVEYDEDVREAAVRELEEETGLDVSIDFLSAVESCFDDPRGNAILILYTGHIEGGEMRAADDAGDIGFFPLDDLPPIAFEAHRKVLSEIAQRLQSSAE